MSDQDSLEDALDGLVDAVEYAEDIEEHELAKEISGLYQKLGSRSPDEHWDGVHKCRVKGHNLWEVVEDVDEVMSFEDSVDNEIEVHATDAAISRLEDHDNVSDVEVTEE